MTCRFLKVKLIQKIQSTLFILTANIGKYVLLLKMSPIELGNLKMGMKLPLKKCRKGIVVIMLLKEALNKKLDKSWLKVM